MKAIILSAGYGTRLRPITDSIAKPLVKVLGVPVIEYTLNLLDNVGVDQVFINRHHFPDQFDGLNIPGRMNVTYSIEDQILGTLGGVLSFEEQILSGSDDDFFVINGDIIFDITPEDMILRHKRKKNIATMALKPILPGTDPTPVYVDDFSNIVQIGRNDLSHVYKPYMFAGIHIINRDFFNRVDKTKKIPSCIVRDFYIPYLKAGGHINSFLMNDNDVWLEIGDIGKYIHANVWMIDNLYKYKLKFSMEELLSDRMGKQQVVDGLWIKNGSSIEHDATIIPPVLIGGSSRIGNGSVIGPNVIIGDNVEIKDGVHIDNSVVMDNLKVEQGIRYSNSLLGPNGLIWSSS